jgi:hypothetical protein
MSDENEMSETNETSTSGDETNPAERAIAEHFKLKEAAHGFAKASVATTSAIEATNKSGERLASSVQQLAAELLRPATPLLRASTLLARGLAGIYSWTGARVDSLASVLSSAAEVLAAENDAAGLPTLPVAEGLLDQAFKDEASTATPSTTPST